MLHVCGLQANRNLYLPVGECLQAGTEDAPVLDCPAPLRRFRDSGAGYKYPELLTYLLTYLPLIPYS